MNRKVVVVRGAVMEDAELKRRFDHAVSLPLWGGVMECIRRMEYDVTERAARLAEGRPEEAARALSGLNVLRALEADLHGWAGPTK